MSTTITVKELWLYPVKSCQGVSVDEAELTPTGFALDRTWCFVDLEGSVVSKCEAISGRKMSALFRISVSFEGEHLVLRGDGGYDAVLRVPVDPAAYVGNKDILVECSGRSTSSGKEDGWSLGYMTGKDAGPEAREWINGFLNGTDKKNGRRRSGKSKDGSFALVRSMDDVLSMEDYPRGLFPVIDASKTDPGYASRFAGNYRRFQDFAPLMITNAASATFLTDRARADDPQAEGPYPMRCFRASIVMDAPEAWAEETWGEISISSAGGSTSDSVSASPITMKKIKECPRCTIPCRNPDTGTYLYEHDKLKLWTVLKRIFPDKASDPEWGSWAGVFFGVYFGHASQSGTVRVGDTVTPTSLVRWDQHLMKKGTITPTGMAACLLVMGLAVAVVALLQASVGAQNGGYFKT